MSTTAATSGPSVGCFPSDRAPLWRTFLTRSSGRGIITHLFNKVAEIKVSDLPDCVCCPNQSMTPAS
jgi:hypothetical protein